MDFFCIVFGCPTKITPDDSDNGQTRLCPRCNNVAVFAAKKRMWIEICFVPLIPMKSSSVWQCSICGWYVDKKQPNGYAPPLPGPPQGYNLHYQPHYGPPPGQQWGQQPHGSYQGGQAGQYQQPGYGYGPGR